MSSSAASKIKKPKLSKSLLRFMDQFLGKKKKKTVLEIGSGGSTLWFAKRAKSIISFEHNRKYFLVVKEQLEEARYKNTTLCYDKEYWCGSLQKIQGLFDIVLVDGRERVITVLSVWDYVKPGGCLILDDAHRRRYKEACDFMDAKEWERLEFPTTTKYGRTFVWHREII